MDDEKYVCFDGDNMPGSARCYTNDKDKCLDDVRFYGNEFFFGCLFLSSALALSTHNNKSQRNETWGHRTSTLAARLSLVC